jgi:hypothetical protein
MSSEFLSQTFSLGSIEKKPLTGVLSGGTDVVLMEMDGLLFSHRRPHYCPLTPYSAY